MNAVMEEEIWREVKGYEGLYEVSNLGRIKSFHKREEGVILKPDKNPNGYLYIGLCKGSVKKSIKVHQLVAIAFLNHTPNGCKIVVDHIDNDPLNNRLDNLQIITQRENLSKDKTTEFTGVQKRGEKFKSVIKSKGKIYTLGTFTTAEEASLYYRNAVIAIENGTEIITAKKIKSSKYKGVSWSNERNKWAVQHKGKNLGRFATEEEAYERLQLEIKKSLHLQQI